MTEVIINLNRRYKYPDTSDIELVGICDLDANENWIADWEEGSHEVYFFKAKDGRLFESCDFEYDDDVPNGEGWDFQGGNAWIRLSKVSDLRKLPLWLPCQIALPDGWIGFGKRIQTI